MDLFLAYLLDIYAKIAANRPTDFSSYNPHIYNSIKSSTNINPHVVSISITAAPITLPFAV